VQVRHTPHDAFDVHFIINFSLEVFVQKNANFSPKALAKKIQTSIEVLYISSLWCTYKAQI